MVNKVTPREYSCSDTFTFLKDLGTCNIKGKFTILYGVTNLFINIPLDVTLEFLKISSSKLQELFVFCTLLFSTKDPIASCF